MRFCGTDPGLTPLSEPAAFKACPAQTVLDVRAVAEKLPEQARRKIFDHENNRALIDSIMMRGNPAAKVRRVARESHVKSGFEPVGVRFFNLQRMKVTNGREYDLGREWKRCDRSPRRDSAIVRPKRNASSRIIVESSFNAIDLE